MSFYEVNGKGSPTTGCQPNHKIDGLPGGGVEQSIYGFAHYVCSQLAALNQSCHHRIFTAAFDLPNTQSKIEVPVPAPISTMHMDAPLASVANGVLHLPYIGDWDITFTFLVVHAANTFAGSLPFRAIRPRTVTLRMTDGGYVDAVATNRLNLTALSESPYSVEGVTLSVETHTASTIGADAIQLLYSADFERADYLRGFGFIYAVSDCSAEVVVP